MKVLTAINDSELIKNLKDNGFDTCPYNIQYKEGILEYIELNSFVDYIVLDFNLPGDIDIKDLISKVLKQNPLIKIIVVNQLNIKEVYKCFDKYDRNDLLDFLIIDCDIRDYYKYKNKGKIITILGASGVGKSVFSINLANCLNCEKKVIIDFDVLNNSLHYLLGVENYSAKVQAKIKKNLLNKSYVYEKEQDYIVNSKDFTMKTIYNVDLISGVNLVFDTQSQVTPENIGKIILKLKNYYDIIIIDTSSQCFLEYNKEVMKLSDELIFLSGASLYEVQKAKILLKKYTEDYKIDKNKIYIVFNKCTKSSIDESILRELFKEYKVLGKIKLRDYYDYIINNNKSKQKKINREIKQIEKRGGFGGKSIRQYNNSKSRDRKLRKSAK